MKQIRARGKIDDDVRSGNELFIDGFISWTYTFE